MRKLHVAGIVVLVLLIFAVGAQSASASETAVTSGTLTGNFGTLVDSSTFSVVNGSIISASIAENVYSNAGTYTYVFDVTNNGPDSLAAFTTGTTVNNFSSTDNYGTVSLGVVGGTTNGGTLSGFDFDPFQLIVNLSGALPSGDQFTFYAQGGAPIPGQFAALDGGTASTSAGPLDPGPEPSSMLLFGTGILVFGIMLRRRAISPVV